MLRKGCCVLDLLLLFASSFLAATLIPAQSELVLAGLVLAANHNPMILIAVATVGNVLGAAFNWLLGRYLDQFKHRRWFPVKARELAKAAQIYQRYGVWSLLFSWLPFIGDPLTVIAGLLGTSFTLFLLLVSIGKLARYVLVVLAAV
jgi:membrane protein YqaA with SNARE-associated domain